MTRRPLITHQADPGIALARQALRGRRVARLRAEADRLDTTVTRIDQRVEQLRWQRATGVLRAATADRALRGLARRRAATVHEIDTRLAELARLRKETR